MSMTTDAIVTTARSTHSATMNDTQRKLRYEVMKFLLRECRPPTVQDLVSQGFEDEVSVTTGLEKLRDLHHLALYEPGTPSPTPIAMAHPFSHLYVSIIHARSYSSERMTTNAMAPQANTERSG